MFIEKLKLQNFRSIPRLTLGNLQRLNCLIGPHNSGKTNILDGISIFWDAFTRAQTQKNLLLKTSLGQEVQQAPPILSYIGKTNTIRGTFELKVVKGIDSWRENSYIRENFVNTTFIHTQRRSHDIFNSFLDSIETMVNPSRITALKFDMTLSQEQLMFIEQKCFLRLNNDELLAFQSENLPIIQQAIGSAFIRRFHEKSYHEFLKEKISRLIKNRNYEAITAIENFLKDVIGQVFVFELEQGEIEVTIEHAYTSPLWRMSSSVIRMISLAYLLTASPINQIILIDDPSLYLHPKGERKLARKLVGFSRDHQLIFSTHSTRLLIGHAYLVDLVKGWTKVRPIKGEKSIKKVVKLLGIRPSDSLGANVVVFVEGRTDARVFRVFEDLILGDLSRNPNNRVSYIGVGGWTNMKFVLSIELLKSKFVRSRALAVTDGDIVDSKEYLKIKKNWNSIFPENSFLSLRENSIETLFINNPRVFLRAFPQKNESLSINEIQEFIKRNRERGVSDKNITRKILDRFMGGKRYGSTVAELLAKKFLVHEIPEYLIRFYKEFILLQT